VSFKELWEAGVKSLKFYLQHRYRPRALSKAECTTLLSDCGMPKFATDRGAQR
jgi:hypothetical protein